MSEAQLTPPPEEWRDITPEMVGRPVLPGYQISNHGRVRSRRKFGYSDALRDEWRQLAGRPNRDGYIVQSLMLPARKTGKFLRNRLVALAFVGPPPPGKPEVCHYNGDPQDNLVTNLRWGSQADNRADAERMGRIGRGETHYGATLKNFQVLEIVQLWAWGMALADIARQYNRSFRTVSNIVNGHSWRSVTGMQPPDGRWA